MRVILGINCVWTIFVIFEGKRSICKLNVLLVGVKSLFHLKYSVNNLPIFHQYFKYFKFCILLMVKPVFENIANTEIL